MHFMEFSNKEFDAINTAKLAAVAEAEEAILAENIVATKKGEQTRKKQD
jgi:hypothetical protein